MLDDGQSPEVLRTFKLTNSWMKCNCNLHVHEISVAVDV